MSGIALNLTVAAARAKAEMRAGMAALNFRPGMHLLGQSAASQLAGVRLRRKAGAAVLRRRAHNPAPEISHGGTFSRSFLLTRLDKTAKQSIPLFA
jgi:hypothetical protein